MKRDVLNPEQRAAVKADSGPVAIVAGPGTGKTKTLTARIAFLIESGRAEPEEITALTFTNKAAREMRERVAALLGPRVRLPRIATFHALGHEILSARSDEQLQFVRNDERLEIVQSLSKSQDLKGFNTRELAARISRFKTSLHAKKDDEIAKLTKRYNAALAEKGLYDFDDLLSKTFALLSGDEQLHKRMSASCRYLLVDEFQDTNELQYEIVRLLAGSDYIFVIGDPLQSIYAFRGASGDIFERFKTDFPNRQSITLTTNYRSTPEIVAVSNAVFPAGPQLKAHQKSGGRAQVVQVLNEYSEAEWILHEIEQHLGGTDMLKGHEVDAAREQVRKFSDYAVLYRTHRTAKVLEQKLADSGMPYQIVGDDSPYEQPFVKTILQALRSLIYADSDARLTKLLQNIDTDKSLSQIVQQIMNKLGLKAKDDAEARTLSQFMSTLVRFDDRPPTEYLKHIDAIAEQGFYDSQAEAVTLLTIHAAKGLEFTHVFLIAAEEGLLPHIRKNKPTDFDEEHRLFYVAVTRAQKQLDILHAKSRSAMYRPVHGGSEPAKLSRFAEAVPTETLPHVTDPAIADQQKKLQKRRLKRAQQSLL